MRQWFILFSKEHKEMLKNYKWIWVPLVFMILGAMQPISSYYLPEIIENFGGLPEGAVLEMPVPSAGEVLAGTLGQYSQVGILILVLATMGIVSNERSTGSFIMILVKPVSYLSFITAKWASAILFTISSFFLGYLFSAYYTHLLIGTFSISDMLVSAIIYSLWLSFIMTVLLLFSTILESNGAIAFLTIGSTMILSIVTSLFKKYMYWSPARLSTHSNSYLISGQTAENFLSSILVTSILIIFILFLTTKLFQKKELVH